MLKKIKKFLEECTPFQFNTGLGSEPFFNDKWQLSSTCICNMVKTFDSFLKRANILFLPSNFENNENEEFKINIFLNGIPNLFFC